MDYLLIENQVQIHFLMVGKQTNYINSIESTHEIINVVVDINTKILKIINNFEWNNDSKLLHTSNIRHDLITS